jgi:hypothetical protein
MNQTAAFRPMAKADFEISDSWGSKSKSTQRVVVLVHPLVYLHSCISSVLRVQSSPSQVASGSVFVSMEQLYQLPFDRYSPRDKQR